ncbi:PTS sugar transporter subunit IIA [Ligilactobacillus sp. Marseille-Q7487]|uniref:BglG family transcription antiterminator n=1 Tax=Ligilactobacillus sp. Marseille-Q7487 TaxID=3022128 RepID=UPI0024A8DBBB|nr:PTS sugar transporter subunit IIA [Ligilactobacillus sp. Marseille-Q7487]
MRLFLLVTELNSTDAYKSIDYLSQKYQVTKRTIQSDIAYLKNVSSKHGFQMHTKRGEGYFLEIIDKELFDDFLKFLDKNSFLDYENQREKLILTYILLNNSYVSMEKIADYFRVSRTLIKNTLTGVGKLAKENNLFLEKKSHYGLKINGNRDNIINYLIKALNANDIVLENLLKDKLSDFTHIENDIAKIINSERLDVYYVEFSNIISVIKIIMLINTLNFSSDKEVEEYEVGENIDQLAAKIIALLEMKYQLKICESDRVYLRKILYEKVKQPFNIREEMLENDIDAFLLDIDKKYKTSFYRDLDFKRMLKLHVSMLLDRLNREVSYQNPVANELSIKEPMIFNIAIKFGEMLNAKYGVTSSFDELGFIAMHFAAHIEREQQEKLLTYNNIGIVCSSGLGSAYMLKLKLQSIFQKANIKTFSFLQQDELQAFTPDIIFTVMPLNLKIDCPIIYIKELLNEKDFYHIRNIVQNELSKSVGVELKESKEFLYSNLFNKKFFKIYSRIDKSYTQIIHEMAVEIEKYGYGQSDYSDMLLKRESYASTIYQNGICIPHPLETNAKKSVISIAINQGYALGESKVSVIFMICLRRRDVRFYTEISKVLYKLINMPKYVERMVEAKSLEEVTIIFKEIEGELYE